MLCNLDTRPDLTVLSRQGIAHFLHIQMCLSMRESEGLVTHISPGLRVFCECAAKHSFLLIRVYCVLQIFSHRGSICACRWPSDLWWHCTCCLTSSGASSGSLYTGAPTHLLAFLLLQAYLLIFAVYFTEASCVWTAVASSCQERRSI